MRYYLQQQLQHIKTKCLNKISSFSRHKTTGFYLKKNILYTSTYIPEQDVFLRQSFNLLESNDVKRLYNADELRDCFNYEIKGCVAQQHVIHNNLIFPATVISSLDKIFVSEIEEQFNYDVTQQQVFYYYKKEHDSVRVFFYIIHRDELQQYRLIYQKHNITPEHQLTIGHALQGLLMKVNCQERVIFIVSIDEYVSFCVLDTQHIYKQFSITSHENQSKTLSQHISQLKKEEQCIVYTLGATNTKRKTSQLRFEDLVQTESHDSVAAYLSDGLSLAYPCHQKTHVNNISFNDVLQRMCQYSSHALTFSFRLSLIIIFFMSLFLTPYLFNNYSTSSQIYQSIDEEFQYDPSYSSISLQEASKKLHSHISYHPSVPTADQLIQNIWSIPLFGRLNIINISYELTSLPTPSSIYTNYASHCKMIVYSSHRSLLHKLEKELYALSIKPSKITIKTEKNKRATIDLYFQGKPHAT